MRKSQVRRLETATRLTDGMKANQSWLFRRMLLEHDKLAPKMAAGDWVAACLAFREEGMTKPDGSPLSPVYCRQVWWKVERLVPRLAEKAAAREAQRQAELLELEIQRAYEEAKIERKQRAKLELAQSRREIMGYTYGWRPKPMFSGEFKLGLPGPTDWSEEPEGSDPASAPSNVEAVSSQPSGPSGDAEVPIDETDDPDYLEAIAEGEALAREMEQEAWRASQRAAGSAWSAVEQVGRDARPQGRS